MKIVLELGFVQLNTSNAKSFENKKKEEEKVLTILLKGTRKKKEKGHEKNPKNQVHKNIWKEKKN